MNCKVETLDTDDAQTLGTVLPVHYLITLKAAHRPVTHICVTTVCQSADHEMFTQIQAHSYSHVKSMCLTL